MVDDMPGALTLRPPGAPLASFIKESIIHLSTQNMKTLGHMVSKKTIFYVFMPPTLKKLEGHIAFGLSVCLCVCASVNF